MSSVEILTNFDQDVELIEHCSLPQLVKQDLQRFIFWGEFVKEDWEPESLFSLMERAAQYNILTYIRDLGLSAERTQEINQHYEEIETHLLEKEYGAWELAYPSSLYMRCIQALVRGSKEPCNNICIYPWLPRQTRFHVLYYEQLALHMEEKVNKQLLGS